MNHSSDRLYPGLIHIRTCIPAGCSYTLAMGKGSGTHGSTRGALQLADGAFVTGSGQTIFNTHTVTQDCIRYGCAIHHPSDHSLRAFPTQFRNDRGLMERRCPHGVGHPDPDHIAFVRRTLGKEAAGVESIHNCDGCCLEDE